jgi:hypothetical protein
MVLWTWFHGSTLQVVRQAAVPRPLTPSQGWGDSWLLELTLKHPLLKHLLPQSTTVLSLKCWIGTKSSIPDTFCDACLLSLDNKDSTHAVHGEWTVSPGQPVQGVCNSSLNLIVFKYKFYVYILYLTLKNLILWDSNTGPPSKLFLS